MAKRLGMSDKSLYLWVRLPQQHQGVGSGDNASLKAEVSRLKAELKRANEKRDILKKGRHVLCQAVRVKVSVYGRVSKPVPLVQHVPGASDSA